MKTQHKVVLALGIVLAASVWALSGSSQTDPYLDVHDVERDPAVFSGSTVSVKGDVVAGSTTTDNGTIRFRLADASGDPAHAGRNVTVVYAGVLPDAFGPKMVVVTGSVVATGAGVTLHATDIQVGCSSKY